MRILKKLRNILVVFFSGGIDPVAQVPYVRLRNGLPPPVVPKELREILADYPEHLERVQESLNDYVCKPFKLMLFDGAIWALEGITEAFINEADKELAIARGNGNEEAIVAAEEKLRVMRHARSKGGGLSRLDEVYEYITRFERML